MEKYKNNCGKHTMTRQKGDRKLIQKVNSFSINARLIRNVKREMMDGK